MSDTPRIDALLSKPFESKEEREERELREMRIGRVGPFLVECEEVVNKFNGRTYSVGYKYVTESYMSEEDVLRSKESMLA